MTQSLAEGLPLEIERVRQLQKRYELLRGIPQAMVEPQIAMMDASLTAALRAAASGDAAEMLRCYQDLRGYED